MLVKQQEKLFKKINAIPFKPQTKIVDKFIDKLWLEEVNQRKNEIESGAVSLVDGDKVFKKIAKPLEKKDLT